MKAASHNFHPEHSQLDSPASEKHAKSSRVQYFLGAALIVLAYFLASWFTSTPSAPTNPAGFGFLAFWMGGGLVTLALLTIAAKR